MNLKKIIPLISVMFFLAIFSSSSFAQCNSFTKKKCMPQLTPFMHNGQLNSTTILAGESAELQMTFYSGQEYRLLVCGQEALGDVHFKVKSTDGKIVYDGKDNGSSWDFNVKSTQELTIEVVSPESKSATGLNANGCVSVLVGFKNK